MLNIEDISPTFDNLEELIADAFLIDLLAEKKAEVFENVVFEKKRRYYIEDLSQRDYTLENTSPYQLKIFDKVIEEHSWGNMLCKCSELLLELYPDYKDRLLDFRCKWSDKAMYSVEEKTNHKKLSNGLFINVNHTALHACWFIQDLLEYFKVDLENVYFLIHRPCSAEPLKVREYIEQRFKKDFEYFICTNYKKSTESVNKIFRLFDKYLNPLLRTISKSYTNFFLFDDNLTLYNYVSKVKEKIAQRFYYDENAKSKLNKCLDYLVKFYKEG